MAVSLAPKSANFTASWFNRIAPSAPTEITMVPPPACASRFSGAGCGTNVCNPVERNGVITFKDNDQHQQHIDHRSHIDLCLALHRLGMGSYDIDSHNVERIVEPDGNVRNEGDIQVAVQPYQIPYRVMLPKKVEAENLLVPVAFSATHVAYSSIRMEPQYMILGHAAGVAARLAVASGKAVQDIDVSALIATLREQGAILEYQPNPHGPALQLFSKLTRPKTRQTAEEW